ncbi:hypothetical protein DL95DRAFT_416283 [Leptodontidium sp. 2 PMI_412]|nr:hypothetical protein DL95DRAFT_416283 [Leptodontidium sp. 2 PMI_412]
MPSELAIMKLGGASLWPETQSTPIRVRQHIQGSWNDMGLQKIQMCYQLLKKIAMEPSSSGKPCQNDLASLSNLPVELHLMILDQLRLGEADELVRFSCPFLIPNWLPMIQNRFNSRWVHLTSRGNLQYAVTAYYEEKARMLNSIPRNEMLDVCRLKALDFHPQRGFSSKNKTLWDRVIDEPEHRAPSLHIPGTGHVWSSGNFLLYAIFLVFQDELDWIFKDLKVVTRPLVLANSTKLRDNNVPLDMRDFWPKLDSGDSDKEVCYDARSMTQTPKRIGKILAKQTKKRRSHTSSTPARSTSTQHD